MIDGYKLMMSLNDWWYSSFGYKETEESKAIKAVLDKVAEYVEQAEQTEPQTEKCPFDDPIPCEWVCTEWNHCKYKPKDEPQSGKE